MRHLTTLLTMAITLTGLGQQMPYNPDENSDAFISTPDLMEFLAVFGYEWQQQEILVDSIPLSLYLNSLQMMIESSALPEGTVPGQFLRWDGESWELVVPRVGCTIAEAATTTNQPMSLTSLSAFLLMLVVFVVAQDQFTSVAVPTFLKVTATARVTWWTPSAIVGEIVLPIWTEMGFVMMVMSVLARQMSVAFAMVQVRFMIVAVREFQLWHAIASEILILIQTGCVTRKMTVSVNSMQQGFAMELSN